MNGKYARVDLWGDACDLPLLEDAVDYIHSSHCFEHISNPILALLEANRVIRDGGYWMAIVPLPGAHAPDKGRDLAAWGDWKGAYDFNWTPDNLPELVLKAAGGPRGHIFVYSPETLKSLIKDAMREFGFNWELVDSEEKDSKVSNGFTLVYRVHKQPVTPKDDLTTKRDLGIISQQTFIEKVAPNLYESYPTGISEVPATGPYPFHEGYLVPPNSPLLNMPEGGIAEAMKRILEQMNDKARQGLLEQAQKWLKEREDKAEPPAAESVANVPKLMTEYPDEAEDVEVKTLDGSTEMVHIPSKEEAEQPTPPPSSESKEDDVYYPKEGEFIENNPSSIWVDKNGNW